MASAGVVIQRGLSLQERSAVLRGRVRDAEGYFRMTNASQAQIDIPKDMAGLGSVRESAPPGRGCTHLPSGRITGFIEERPHGHTHLFRLGALHGMYTRTDHVADGSHLTLYEDLLTSKVGDSPATATLAVNRGKTALWKVAWVQGRFLNELYLQTAVEASGTPALAYSQALRFAAQVRCSPA